MNPDRLQILVTLSLIIGSVILLISVFYFKSIKASILSIFGGSIELSEAAGCIFLCLFAYMIIKEGNRDHEWHYYNELYIFFTAGAAMTGLGLKDVLNTVRDIRTNSTGKTNKDESETP